MRSVPESCQQFASLDTFRVAYLLRECLLSTVVQAHAGLSEVALTLRLGLPPNTPVLKTAIKAKRAAFDLKRFLQRLEVKDVATT